MNTCKKDGFVFRKVVIPATLGDDVTGKDKPTNGAYTNSYVEYEANGAQYIYDSGGIYTKLSSGGGVTDFDSLSGRPQYSGVEMDSTTSIPNVDDAVAAEASARIAADNALSTRIDNISGADAIDDTDWSELWQ